MVSVHPAHYQTTLLHQYDAACPQDWGSRSAHAHARTNARRSAAYLHVFAHCTHCTRSGLRARARGMEGGPRGRSVIRPRNAIPPHIYATCIPWGKDRRFGAFPPYVDAPPPSS